MSHRPAAFFAGTFAPDSPMPLEPAAAMEALGLTVYAAELTRGDLVQNELAQDDTGALDRRRRDALFAMPVHRDGAPYRLHYDLRAGAGTIAVEDGGRLAITAGGEPVARGLMRIRAMAAVDTAGPMPRRAVLLAAIAAMLLDMPRLALILAAPPQRTPELRRRLTQALRAGDRAFRLDGARVAVLARIDAGDVPLAVSRLKRAAGMPLAVAAVVPASGETADTLLRRAERALLGGRRQGPSADPELRVLAALNERRLSLALSQVAGRDGDLLHLARPVLIDADGAMADVQALLDRAPPELRRLADHRLVEQAAALLRGMPRHRLGLRLTAAPTSGLADLIAALGILDRDFDRRLVLIVPERAAREDADLLRTLAADGPGLGLHGFGAGGASLADLGTLPLSCLVLDDRIVDAAARSGDARFLLRNLAACARHLDARAIAPWTGAGADKELLARCGIVHVEDRRPGPAAGRPQPIAGATTLAAAMA